MGLQMFKVVIEVIENKKVRAASTAIIPMLNQNRSFDLQFLLHCGQ